MSRPLALAALASLLLARSASAAPAFYPVNGCVSSKQAAAAAYCGSVFQALAKYETTQDAGKRDATIARVGGKVDALLSRAETKSAAAGSDCADTTLGASSLRAAIDSAAAAIVGDVNSGLNLANKDDAKCGARLLRLAGAKCNALLKAESKFIDDPSADPTRGGRDAAELRARAKFATGFFRTLHKGCPTNATVGQVEGAIDGVVDSTVRDTTISPNVDNTQFTTYSPTGPIEYLGKTLNPTCVKNTPYAYFAKRGSVNKLLVYYEGGGACWEQLTCSVPACDTTVKTDAGSASDNPQFATTGFADQSNPANPFRDWNVVFISYCSCDIHFGDAAQDYANIDPAHPLHIEHRGFENARVVEKWAREHFVDPEEVFVTGSSAGAYGAWFHAPLLQEVWPASRFQVLADAGNGVVTQDFLNDFFPNWNFIGNIPPEFPEIKAIIQNGGGIPAYTEFVAGHFPKTRWAHYASAYDGGSGGQTGFYNIMLNNNNPIDALTWWNGSCAFNDVMVQQAHDTYAAISPLTNNYRYYIGSGSRHTMWGSNKVYNDTTGGVPLLVDWVNGMLDGTPAWTNVTANDFGLLLPGDPRPNTLPTAPFFQVGPDVKVICSPNGAFLE